MNRIAKNPRAPRIQYKIVDEEYKPKKHTILLNKTDEKMLETLAAKYKNTKSHILRKGIEVLYMNANNAVYFGSDK